MKRILSLLALSLVFTTAFAVKYPADKQLKKHQFDAAQTIIFKQLRTTPNSCEANFAAYIFYADTLNPQFNPDSAYTHLSTSLDTSRSRKLSKELQKKGYKQELYEQQFANLAPLILTKAQQLNSLTYYQFAAENYRRLPPPAKRQITAAINAMEYQNLTDNNPTIEQLEEYIKQHPYAKERKKAQQLIYSNLYEQAVQSDSIPFVEYAINQCDKTQYAEPLKEHLFELQFRAISDNYNALIKELGKTLGAQRELVEEQLFQLTTQTPTFNAVQTLLPKYYTQPYADSLLTIFHDFYFQTPDIEHLALFQTECPERDVYAEKKQQLVQRDQQIINAYRRLNQMERLNRDSVIAYIHLAAPHHTAYKYLTLLNASLIDQQEFHKADSIAQMFKNDFKSDPNYLAYCKILQQPVDNSIHKTPFPKTINQAGTLSYIPIVTADEKTLYYCHRLSPDDQDIENIYISHKYKNQWQAPHLLEQLSSPNNNEAPVSVSVDGNTLILFISGMLYTSQRTATGWAKPELLPDNLNSAEWQADAMISSDGKAFIFAARKFTEYDLPAKYKRNTPYRFSYTNIFVSVKNRNGNWTMPISLGPTINTSLCERAPFLHPDMKTLYFASESHGSIGGLDIFKSTRLREDSWTEWSEPINLGKDINTPYDDCWYNISTNGKTAYFAAQTDSVPYELFSLNLPPALRPELVATVSGKLIDTHGKPIDANIIWEDLNNNQIVGQSRSNPQDGTFFIVLPQGKVYGYYVENKDIFPISDNIDLTEINSMVEISKDIKVYTIQEMIQQAIPMPLNNLFFPSGRSQLLPQSAAELQRIAKIIIKQNRKIEIAGHTDNVGNDKDNLLLSEQRAQAVYNFLIEQGCPPELLTFKGYGKSKPIAPNNTPQGRQLNRRVEIIFR